MKIRFTFSKAEVRVAQVAYDILGITFVALAIFLAYLVCTTYGDRVYYENAFRSEMANNEAILRTLGRAPSVAYVCREK